MKIKELKEVVLKFPLSENFPKLGKLDGAFEIDKAGGAQAMGF